MQQTLTKVQWLDRFTSKLGKLLPSLSLADATKRAEETFSDTRDLEPEEAAEIYALELPPADPGEPGD